MNKHLYFCHLLVLSSPTLMMHGHMNLKFKSIFAGTGSIKYDQNQCLGYGVQRCHSIKITMLNYVQNHKNGRRQYILLSV